MIPEESLFCMFSFTNRKLKVKLSFNNILSFPTYGVTCTFLKVSPLPTGHNLLNVLDKVLFRGDPFWKFPIVRKTVTHPGIILRSCGIHSVPEKLQRASTNLMVPRISIELILIFRQSRIIVHKFIELRPVLCIKITLL